MDFDRAQEIYDAMEPDDQEPVCEDCGNECDVNIFGNYKCICQEEQEDDEEE